VDGTSSTCVRAAPARTWAQRWRDYFVDVYPTDVKNDDAQYGYDHIYGWGLVLWGVKEGDAAALAAAEKIGDVAMLGSGASPSPSGAIGYGGGDVGLGGQSWRRISPRRSELPSGSTIGMIC
jgi:hypothetical protein